MSASENSLDTKTALTVLITTVNNLPEGSERNSFLTNLYKRISEKFYNRCSNSIHKLFRNSPDWEAIRDDIFQETFLTAFDNLKKFKIKNEWQDAECEKVLLSWLSKIANNKALSLIKIRTKEDRDKVGYQEFWEIEQSEGETATRMYEPTYDKDKLSAVWSKFNPMTIDIILACIKNDTIKNNNTDHLPDNVVQAIVAKYKVTPAAIRKAKQRAIEALKTCKI